MQSIEKLRKRKKCTCLSVRTFACNRASSEQLPVHPAHPANSLSLRDLKSISRTHRAVPIIFSASFIFSNPGKCNISEITVSQLLIPAELFAK